MSKKRSPLTLDQLMEKRLATLGAFLKNPHVTPGQVERKLRKLKLHTQGKFPSVLARYGTELEKIFGIGMELSGIIVEKPPRAVDPSRKASPPDSPVVEERGFVLVGPPKDPTVSNKPFPDGVQEELSFLRAVGGNVDCMRYNLQRSHLKPSASYGDLLSYVSSLVKDRQQALADGTAEPEERFVENFFGAVSKLYADETSSGRDPLMSPLHPYLMTISEMFEARLSVLHEGPFDQLIGEGLDGADATGGEPPTSRKRSGLGRVLVSCFNAFRATLCTRVYSCLQAVRRPFKPSPPPSAAPTA